MQPMTQKEHNSKQQPDSRSYKQILSQMIKSNMRQYSMIIALILIMLLFQILTEGILLKPLNITNLILQNSYILVLAIGMVLVIITGHIDLSVGSIAAFVGAIAAILMVDYSMPTYLAVIISLLLGAIIGAWQGFWIAYVKIPAFIVTLAGMLLFRGLTLVVLEGKSIAPFPETFKKISSGFIPDVFGGGNVHLLTLLIGIFLSIIYVFNEIKARSNQKKYSFEVQPKGIFIVKLVSLVVVINIFSYVLAIYEGLPNILIILGILILIYTFAMRCENFQSAKDVYFPIISPKPAAIISLGAFCKTLISAKTAIGECI